MDQPSKSYNNAAGSRGRWVTTVLAIVCALLAIEVLLLVKKNRELRGLLESFSESASGATLVGSRVDPLMLQSVDPTADTVDFGPGQPATLLLVLSPDCEACTQTLSPWRELTAAARSPGLRTVAVIVDTGGSAASSPAMDTGCPTYFLADAPTSGLAEIDRVPATLLLTAEGVIEGAWAGYLTTARQDEIRQAVERLLDRG